MIRHMLASTLVIAAAACATAPTAEQEGARLMAQMKAASGGAALDSPSGFHETGTALRDGMPVTYETWGDLRSLRTRSEMTMGGATLTSGFDGKASWSMGPDGQVAIDTSEEGVSSARLGAYLTVGGYFYPDRFPARFVYAGTRSANDKTYDVVTATPGGTQPVDFWLDRDTHLLQRISGMDGATPFEGDVGRYETIDGAMIGFELHQKQGDHRMDMTLTHYVFEPVPAQQFAPPVR